MFECPPWEFFQSVHLNAHGTTSVLRRFIFVLYHKTARANPINPTPEMRPLCMIKAFAGLPPVHLTSLLQDMALINCPTQTATYSVVVLVVCMKFHECRLHVMQKAAARHVSESESVPPNAITIITSLPSITITTTPPSSPTPPPPSRPSKKNRSLGRHKPDIPVALLGHLQLNMSQTKGQHFTDVPPLPNSPTDFLARTDQPPRKQPYSQTP